MASLSEMRSGYSSDQRAVFDVLGYDGACRDDGAGTYADARHNDGAGIDEDVVADHDGCNVDCKRPSIVRINWTSRLRRQMDVRTQMHIVADRQPAAAPQHTVRTDLDIIPDRNEAAATVDGTWVQIRTMIDEDVATDRDAIRAANDRVRRETHAAQTCALLGLESLGLRQARKQNEGAQGIHPAIVPRASLA
jgi:hypothetical protein